MERRKPSGDIRRRRRRAGWILLVIGGVLLAASALSFWRGMGHWSAVRAPGTSAVHQRFVLLVRGELRVGTRGTAGFFTRAIATPGWEWKPPGRMLLNPPGRVWMAWRYTGRQTVSYILPVLPIAAAMAGVGVAMLVVRPRPEWACKGCGYDLRGTVGGVCPECGTVCSACASSTSQPG